MNQKIKNKKMKSGIGFCILALAFPMAHFIFMFFLNNGGTILLSFQEFSMETGKFEWVGFKNFTTLIRVLFSQNSEFPIALKNSVIFFAVNNFIILPISVCCGILCYKRIPCGNFFRIVLYLPTVISPVILALLYSFAWDGTVGFIPAVLEKLNLSNLISVKGFLADEKTALSLLVVYAIWIGTGGPIILITGAISKIPDHILELDKMYGLGFFQEIRYVILPLIGPTISLLFLQGLGVILGYYMPVLLITGGQAKTTTYALFSIQLTQGGQRNYGFAAAMSIISTFIMAPIVLICKIFVDKKFPAYEY